jgi:MFS family permease
MAPTSGTIPGTLLRARVSVTLFLALFGAADGVWLARIPAVKQHLGLSDGVLGLALLASPAGVILVALVAGRLVDRVGSGLPTAVAGVLVPLLPIGFGLAGSLAALVAALLAFGLAAGLLDVAANVHALRVQRAYRRPLISSFHACYSGGAIGGALLGGAFAWASVPPAVSFAAVGIPLAVVALLASRGLLRGRERGAGAGHAAEGERPSPDAAPAGGAAGIALRPRRVSPRLLVLGGLAVCSLLGEGAAGNWSAVYMHDSLSAPAGLAATAYAAFSAAMTVGRLAGDRLAARFGPVRLMRGAGLLAAAGLGGGLLSVDRAGAIAGFAIFGAGLSVTFPQLMWAAADADPLRPGSAVARVAGMGYVGLLGGPVLIGGCATLAGLPTALAIPVVLMVGMALAAGAVARPVSAWPGGHSGPSPGLLPPPGTA